VTRLVGSELFKLRTTRTFYGLTLIPLALMLVIVVLVLSLEDWRPGDEVLRDISGAAFFMHAISLLFGILIVTSEFRHGTITPSLLVVPNRITLTIVKLLAALAMGALIGLLTVLLISGVTVLVLSIRGLDTGTDFSTFLELLAGGTAAAALWAGLGVGIGALVRNQVGAIIGVLVWLFVLEGLIGLIPGLDDIVPKYGLNGVRAGLTGADDGGGGGPDAVELLGQVPAGLVMAGYVAVFMAAGLFMMRRRDITA
jgi:ABC-2 type transport system permease protein